MDKQANDIGQPFMEVVTNKFVKQDEKIAGLEERLKSIPDHAGEFVQVKNDLTEIKAIVKRISFPTEEVRELSVNLNASVEILKQPVQNEVRHHHHISKLLWVAIGLLFLTCLFFMLWYSRMEKLGRYKENDTKYRYLKLYDNKNLRQLLDITDSLFLANPGIRDSIIQREDQIRRNLEKVQRAMDMEQEAKKLREEAKEN